MENSSINQSVNVVMSQPQKWRSLFNQFEDVLGLNIFMTDSEGCILIALSEKAKRGDFGSIFLKNTFNFEVQEGGVLSLVNFRKGDDYLQANDPFDFRVFAVPVCLDNEKVNFYLLVGPFILEKSWTDEKYLALAKQLAIADHDFLKMIAAIPRMSSSAINAIVGLLAEVTTDILEIELEKQTLHSVGVGQQVVRPEIINAAQDIFLSIQQDELLVAILDSAIKMAKAQGGSIMTLDDQTNEFVLRVSRGLENKKHIMQARMKFGEGITGMAAAGKIPLFIKGTEGGTQLRPFLKRPEIKNAIIIPLVFEEKVVAVLNLCTKTEENDVVLENIAHDVRQLSRFIAAALHSI